METVKNKQTTETDKKISGRFLKTVNITYTDVAKHHIEEKVNTVISIIKSNGGKVISVYSYIMAAGVSTVYAVYNIIYERDEEINVETFKAKKKKILKSNEKDNENDDE